MTHANFMKRVKVSIDGCWVWHGALNDRGYGRITEIDRDTRKTWLAHRWAYWRIAGLVLPEQLHHQCKNRACVNPEHMEATDNFNHPDAPSVVNRAKTHCPQGHAYAEGNLYSYSTGRYCKQCICKAARDKYAQNREVMKAKHLAYYHANKHKRTY